MLTNMIKQLKLIFLVNVIFVVLYVLLDWLEFSTLITYNPEPVNIIANFPWYVQVGGIYVNGIAIYPNFTLALFLLAILVNLYFIIRLQRTNKAKQDPPQNTLCHLENFSF